MKILFLTTHFNTGGITSYLLSLTQSLTKQGHKVFVASAGGNCVLILESYGGEHIDLGFRTKSELDLRIYFKLSFLRKIIRDERIDIIHAQTRVTQVMAYFLSKMTGKPFIATCHGFFKPRFFRRIFPCWGDATIAISRPVKEHLVKDFYIPENQVYSIANGIDCAQFPAVNEALKESKRQQWNIQAKRVIGIIARLSDVKGIDILLKAMPVVIKQYPDVLLLIVGEGPEKEKLMDLVKDLNIAKNVRFENIVNQTAELLPVFDIFIMPSRQEGLGLSVMEAQASALPVIASCVGGLIDLIEDLKTGYLVAPQDPQALALQIIEVLRNPAKAKEAGLAARENIAQNFSLERMAIATEKVYEKYLSR